MVEKSMKEVVEKFSFDAIQVITNSDLEGFDIILDKQYDLMLDIIEKRNLYNYGIDNLIRNMVLSLVDEINEFKLMFDRKEKKVDKVVEETFELIDALHFIIQLEFLCYIKSQNYTFLQLIKDLSLKDEIINETKNVFKKPLFKLNNNLYIEKTFDDTEIYEKLMMQVSEILEYINWKHWKTYTNFEYKKLSNQIDKFLDLLFESLSYYIDKDDIVLYYVIKNLENFDRQKRNY